MSYFNYWTSNIILPVIPTLINYLTCYEFTGDKQTERRRVHTKWWKSIFGVSSILRHWPPERAAIRKVPAGSEEEPGAAGFGADGVRGAKHHWAHGAEDTDTHAEPYTVSAGAGKKNFNYFKIKLTLLQLGFYSNVLLCNVPNDLIKNAFVD